MSNNVLESLDQIKKAMTLTHAEICGGLVGVEEPAGLLVDGLYAGEHILFEGVPGVGKTELAKHLAAVTLADSEVRPFSRIQGAPDRQPAEVLGSLMYDQKLGDYKTRKGPIFSHIVLADELNKYSPKTMAALNEVIGERQITIGDDTYPLPDPFFVVATHNTHDYGQGTNPIPFSLIDRFGQSYYFGRPSIDDRIQVGLDADNELQIRKITGIGDLREARDFIKGVKVSRAAMHLAGTAIGNIAEDENVRMLGDGYRSILIARKLAKARSIRLGDGVVTVDEIKETLPYVLRHRIAIKTGDPEGVRQDVIEKHIAEASVNVPKALLKEEEKFTA
jgi:MoxR-like ATPase